MKNEAFAAALNNGDNSNGWSFVNGQVLCGAEPADYSAVEAEMAAIPTDLTVYTDESVAALNTAVDGVVRGKAFVSQANVNAMAQAIEDAIAALQYKDANYTIDKTLHCRKLTDGTEPSRIRSSVQRFRGTVRKGKNTG